MGAYIHDEYCFRMPNARWRGQECVQWSNNVAQIILALVTMVIINDQRDDSDGDDNEYDDAMGDVQSENDAMMVWYKWFMGDKYGL